MSYTPNTGLSASSAYQNNAALQQAQELRNSMTPKTENADSTKTVDAAEKANGSKKESVKVEISINGNQDTKSAEFMDKLKSAISDISKNQSESKVNDERLSALNDIKNSLQQAQLNGLFGTSTEVKSFGEIADKMKALKEGESSKSDSSSSESESSSTIEKLGLSGLEKALGKNGEGITAENIGGFIKDLESAINTVSKDKQTNDNAVKTQSDMALEESRKLRESMGYGDEKLAKMKEVDMAKESQNFTKQSVTSQAGSLAQSQGGNAKNADTSKI